MSAPALPTLLVSGWHVDWTLCVEAAAASSLYLVGALRIGRRWPARRTAGFLAAVAAVLLALQSGLDSYDHRLLSVHMAQHMVLLLAAPLLLLSGKPMALALKVLRGDSRRRAAAALKGMRRLTRPWYCLGTFTAIVLLTHLPAFYDATLRHPLLHDAEHGLYLVAGVALWWPLLDGDPVLTERLSGLGRLVYLLAGMVPMAVIGAYLNRHLTAVYHPYIAAASQLRISAVGDQATAGAIMWVVGNTTMVLVGLWAVMAALSDEERRHRAREAYGARGRLGTAGSEGAMRE